MYAQQRLLRAKNQIDIFQGAPCDKCGKISMTLDDELINYSRGDTQVINCLLYTSPSPRDQRGSRMPA